MDYDDKKFNGKTPKAWVDVGTALHKKIRAGVSNLIAVRDALITGQKSLASLGKKSA